MKKLFFAILLTLSMTACIKYPWLGKSEFVSGRVERIRFISSAGGFMSGNIHDMEVVFRDGRVFIFHNQVNGIQQGEAYRFEVGPHNMLRSVRKTKE